MIPAAIIKDSYDRWYKGRDCGPRSGPENSAKAPRGKSEGPVGGETRSVSAVRHETVMKRSLFMTVGMRRTILPMCACLGGLLPLGASGETPTCSDVIDQWHWVPQSLDRVLDNAELVVGLTSCTQPQDQQDALVLLNDMLDFFADNRVVSDSASAHDRRRLRHIYDKLAQGPRVWQFYELSGDLARRQQDLVRAESDYTTALLASTDDAFPFPGVIPEATGNRLGPIQVSITQSGAPSEAGLNCEAAAQTQSSPYARLFCKANLALNALRASGEGALAQTLSKRGSETFSGISMRSARSAGVVGFTVPITFITATAEFTDVGEAVARALLEEALREPGGTRLVFTGHTDPDGTQQYNQDLSLRRAQALRTFFIQNGYQGSIDVEGKGELDPISAANATDYPVDVWKQMLRRVEINVESP